MSTLLNTDVQPRSSILVLVSRKLQPILKYMPEVVCCILSRHRNTRGSVWSASAVDTCCCPAPPLPPSPARVPPALSATPSQLLLLPRLRLAFQHLRHHSYCYLAAPTGIATTTVVLLEITLFLLRWSVLIKPKYC